MRSVLRNANRPFEPIWHVQLTMLVAIILQLALPDRYVFGSRYLLVTIEILLLLGMSLTTPKEIIFRSLARRINVLLLLIVSGVVNCYGLIVVAQKLLQSSKIADGRELIMTAVNIYLTNVIIFGLFYWEMDGGGPGMRRHALPHELDFLFPQQSSPNSRHPNWQPTFIDYLYTSSTNAMAFSPTDTLPLSRRAKLLMLGQATISLVAVALVAARAVNILQ